MITHSADKNANQYRVESQPILVKLLSFCLPSIPTLTLGTTQQGQNLHLPSESVQEIQLWSEKEI